MSLLSCFASKPKDPGSLRNTEIEKILRKDAKKLEQEVKILLLGAGESGKSTVLKQMRLIYDKGFSEDERRSWRPVIFTNLSEAFQIVQKAMESQEITFADSTNAKYSDLLAKDVELKPLEPLPMEYLPAFKGWWVDDGVQSAIKKGNEYALHDNLQYFFEDIDRFFHKDYLPTDQDILRARLRTTGIHESYFDFPEFPCRMFDVGGQRSERKKWIHCFENVHAVLFLVAISAFDHVLIEDQNANQMREALQLYDSIVNSHWFTKSAVILFLNKIDLYRNKVSKGKSSINAYFPDYTGKSTDVEAGQKFFAAKFDALVQDKTKPTYTHFTNATDTDLLNKTMDSVRDLIIQNNLNKFGLL